MLKVRFDENISPRLVKALNVVGAVDFEVDISHLRDVKHLGSADEVWLRAFHRDGGCAIISADSDFHKVPGQIIALIECGMTGIFLPKRCHSMKMHQKVGYLMYWWPKIIERIATSPGAKVWELPFNLDVETPMKERVVDISQARDLLDRQAERHRRHLHLSASRAASKADSDALVLGRNTLDLHPSP